MSSQRPAPYGESKGSSSRTPTKHSTCCKWPTWTTKREQHSPILPQQPPTARSSTSPLLDLLLPSARGQGRRDLGTQIRRQRARECGCQVVGVEVDDHAADQAM